MNTMKSLPDRWLDYKPYGEVIKGTKIVAFKVPLKEAISKFLREDQQFTTAKLREAFPRLKCIIDLTNTARYYDGKEFTNAGISYQKIMTPGRIVPPLDTVMQFFKAMDVFTSTCGEDGLIGVHCTHGVNRTGYLICRYLVQQLGWALEDSLKAFAEARGYTIERDAYVAALKTVPQGKKIDTSNIKLVQPPEQTTLVKKIPSKISRDLKSKREMPYSGRSRYSRPQHSSGGPPFLSQPYGFGRQPPAPAVLRPMPPPGPGGPPPGPMFRPRPFRYGPLMRPPMPPPAMPPPPMPPPPNFLLASGFPPRMPGPSRMPGPPRLGGPPPRLLPPKMAPPPPPPPLPSRPLPPMLKHQQPGPQKPSPVHLRNGMTLPGRAPGMSFVRSDDDPAIVTALPKILNEQDFTVDTFEENLLAPNSGQPRSRPLQRFH